MYRCLILSEHRLALLHFPHIYVRDVSYLDFLTSGSFDICIYFWHLIFKYLIPSFLPSYLLSSPFPLPFFFSVSKFYIFLSNIKLITNQGIAWSDFRKLHLSQNILNNSKALEERAEILWLFVRRRIQNDSGLWRERREGENSEGTGGGDSLYSRPRLPYIYLINGTPTTAGEGLMLVKNATSRLYPKHCKLEILLKVVSRNFFFINCPVDAYACICFGDRWPIVLLQINQLQEPPVLLIKCTHVHWFKIQIHVVRICVLESGYLSSPYEIPVGSQNVTLGNDDRGWNDGGNGEMCWRGWVSCFLSWRPWWAVICQQVCDQGCF